MPNGQARALALKAAFRDLVRAGGGQQRCAEFLGVSQSRISEVGSINHMDQSPRLDHVAALEAEAGGAVVTKLLADLLGLELLPLGQAAPQYPHLHLARIIRDASDVTGAISQALADGRISQHEARSLKREAQEAIETLHGFIAQMNAVLEAAP